MIAGLTIYHNLFQELKNLESEVKCAVLGTGAGMLPMFLYLTMSDTLKHIDTIDIDEEIVTIGKEYFGFRDNTDQGFRSLICDANIYLTQEIEKGSLNIMFIDIGSSDSGEPEIPPKFVLTEEFFEKVKSALNSEHHIVCLNTTWYKSESLESTKEFINTQFKFVSYINCVDTWNVVYILSNSHTSSLNKSPKNTVIQFVKNYCNKNMSKLIIIYFLDKN